MLLENCLNHTVICWWEWALVKEQYSLILVGREDSETVTRVQKAKAYIAWERVRRSLVVEERKAASDPSKVFYYSPPQVVVVLLLNILNWHTAITPLFYFVGTRTY